MLSRKLVFRSFCIISLWILFLVYFGFPSLNNYLKKETIFVESKKKMTPEDLPIIGVNKINFRKDLKNCLETDLVIKECYENTTEEFDKIIKSSAIDNRGIKLKLVSRDDWDTSYVDKRFDRIFVLQNYSISGVEWLLIQFNVDDNNSSLELALYDKKYSVEKSSNMVDFMREIIGVERGQNVLVFIKITEYHLLPETSGCIDEEDYSFLKCTRVGFLVF